MFRSPSFKNSFCSFILYFPSLITIRFFLDPALNLYFYITTILVAGDVLRTVSIRLLKSLFSVSVCRSLVSFSPTCSTTVSMLSSPFRIAVSAQKHREHEHQGNSECALYLQLTWHGRRRSSSPAWIASSAAAPRVRGFPAPEWRTSGKIASRVHGDCAEKNME